MQEVKDCSSSQSYLFYMYAWQLDCGCFCICRKRETQFLNANALRACRGLKSALEIRWFFQQFGENRGEGNKNCSCFSVCTSALVYTCYRLFNEDTVKNADLLQQRNHQIHLTLTALIAARHRAADIWCTAAAVGYGYNSSFWNKYTNKRKYFFHFSAIFFKMDRKRGNF